MGCGRPGRAAGQLPLLESGVQRRRAVHSRGVAGWLLLERAAGAAATRAAEARVRKTGGPQTDMTT